MDNQPTKTLLVARHDQSRRAMSLLELAVVVAILGLLTSAAITRFDTATLATSGAEGLVRRISLTLVHARRSTISTGDNHYLRFTSAGGNIASFALFRRASGGDVQVDQTWLVPQGVTATSGNTILEYDFEGSALAGYSVNIAGPDRSWNVSVVAVTGMVRVAETTP